MTDKKRDADQHFIDKIFSIFLKLPWVDVLRELWKLIQKWWQSCAPNGMYEVLEYEGVLELKDQDGKRATYSKREKVRYLQNNVIAYQDQVWGDGEILINYRCTPGKPVDYYRAGRKRHLLISRRETKNRGDVDTFNIEWEINNGFRKATDYWETHVIHHTKRLEITIIFPSCRPPKLVKLVEVNKQRCRLLGLEAQTLLPDGRHSITWGTTNPRLYENYVLQWEW